MLQICLVFWKSEPLYAYKRYAYKNNNMYIKAETAKMYCNQTEKKI